MSDFELVTYQGRKHQILPLNLVGYFNAGKADSTWGRVAPFTGAGYALLSKVAFFKKEIVV